MQRVTLVIRPDPSFNSAAEAHGTLLGFCWGCLLRDFPPFDTSKTHMVIILNTSYGV